MDWSRPARLPTQFIRSGQPVIGWPTQVTIPFNPPKSSKVAVKVIDKASMETMRALEAIR